MTARFMNASLKYSIHQWLGSPIYELSTSVVLWIPVFARETGLVVKGYGGRRRKSADESAFSET